MLPVIAIVGRPNVGKSTLFNVLTNTRDALVADMPGVTRDRKYGYARFGAAASVLVDTGGLISDAEGIDYLAAKQVHHAIDESALVLFVVSANEGLTAEDEHIASQLRRSAKPTVLVVNKVDHSDGDIALAEFAALGMGNGVAVSCAHRRGIDALAREVEEQLPPVESVEEEEDPDTIRVAVLGRPNVGKSTLINRLLGEERLLSFDEPGTTRDSISTPLERDGQKYLFIDTAGIRRRARVSEAIEKFSSIKALQAMERAQVVVLMLDAGEGMTDQDSTLLGHILRQGRALVIAINKWDGLEPDHRSRVLRELDRKLPYVSWAARVTLSALHGSGLAQLMNAIRAAHASASKELPTPELTRVLESACQAHQPPLKHGRSARLRYAHAGGRFPPRIIIHGNRTGHLPESYKRYLSNCFTDHFKLVGTPVFLEFRDSDNPYKGRKNKLTKRQIAKRKRLKRFTRRRS